MAGPGKERDREAYLAEIGKFKDLIRDCDSDKSTEDITQEEGINCLQNFVSTVSRFFVNETSQTWD